MVQILYSIPRRITFLYVVFLLLYEFTTYIANDMIMPGMINVVHTFKASESMVSASLTAYILGGASLQLFLGPLSDRFGRRPVMLSGTILFLLCTISIITSQSIQQFILARFFQGMGLCFISVVGYATLHEIFAEIHAVRLISIMNNLTILAPLLGPLLGAIVLSYFNWRFIFVAIAILAVISCIGLWLNMPETVGKKRLDGTENPITPLNYHTVFNNYLALVKNKQFIMGSFANGFAMMPLIAWIGTSPLILIKEARLSVMDFALWQIPIFMFVIVGSYLMRRYTHRTSLDKLSLIGSIILIVSLIFIEILSIIFHGHYLALIIGFCLYALGIGFTGAPLNRLVLFSTLVPKGTASALMSMIIMFLMASGNQIGGWLYTTQGNYAFSLFCCGSGLLYFLSFITLMAERKT